MTATMRCGSAWPHCASSATATRRPCRRHRLQGFLLPLPGPQAGYPGLALRTVDIDTALLIVGALAAAMYFDADTPQETELRAIADTLYRRIDWRWARNGNTTIMQG